MVCTPYTISQILLHPPHTPVSLSRSAPLRLAAVLHLLGGALPVGHRTMQRNQLFGSLPTRALFLIVGSLLLAIFSQLRLP
jgi:hypothetical protein